MSRATLAVRFPDGEIRYGIYDGTRDLAYPLLVDTSSEAWALPYRDKGPEIPVEVRSEAVVIFCPLAGGFYWDGRATRTRIVEGRAPYASDEWAELLVNGKPSWWLE